MIGKKKSNNLQSGPRTAALRRTGIQNSSASGLQEYSSRDGTNSGSLASPALSSKSNKSPTGHTGGIVVSSVREAVEAGESLKKELDRVTTGLTLLSQSVEKLIDSVEENNANSSSCLGGIFENCFSSFGSTHRKAGYSRVEGSEDGSSSSLTEPSSVDDGDNRLGLDRSGHNLLRDTRSTQL
jgi:hypothetical protein